MMKTAGMMVAAGTLAATLGLAQPAAAASEAVNGYAMSPEAPLPPDPAFLAALRAAEASGGTVLEIRRDAAGARPSYEAQILRADGVGNAVIGPAGTISTLGDRRPVSSLSVPERRDARSIGDARISMEQAVRTAEATEELPAVGAEFRATRGGLLTYDVATAGQGGGERHVFVDAQTGQVVADPNALTTAF
jgi:hypothetical protein